MSPPVNLQPFFLDFVTPFFQAVGLHVVAQGIGTGTHSRPDQSLHMHGPESLRGLVAPVPLHRMIAVQTLLSPLFRE